MIENYFVTLKTVPLNFEFKKNSILLETLFGLMSVIFSLFDEPEIPHGETQFTNTPVFFN